MSVADQELVFGANELSDATRALGSVGISSGDTVVLTEATPHVVISLPPSMHETFGPTISVALHPEDTLADVMGRVEVQTGVPVTAQTLSEDGSPLPSDGSTPVGDAGVESGDTLDLSLPTEEAPPVPFVVEVSLPPSLHESYGPSIEIGSLSDESTVDELKEAIQSITGMSKSEQEVVHEAIKLSEGTQTLGDAGIESGDTVTLSELAPHVIIALPPSMHETFGPTIAVAASPGDTVRDVMDRVEAHTGVAVADQTLSEDGSVLPRDSTESIGSLGVSNGDTLDLVLEGADAPPYIVKVALPPSLHVAYGPVIDLGGLSPSTTVGALKDAISSVTGMSVADQELVFGANELSDATRALGSVGISSGDTVVLT
ncbi:MAG: ubiquitin family protein, partial [Actinomycetota bacterium]|nr:ubiquitin family protein [Actinomycetota bacterium]